MSIIAFIFARGGSKGLPDKNIKILNGKPLIAWSIEHAKSVKRVDRVIVSTDSEEIARIAREYGAEVPFMRPAALATDNSPEWLSWQHSLGATCQFFPAEWRCHRAWYSKLCSIVQNRRSLHGQNVVDLLF